MAFVAVSCFIQAKSSWEAVLNFTRRHVVWVWLLFSIVISLVAYLHMSHDDDWGKVLFLAVLSTIASIITMVGGWKKVGQVLFGQEGWTRCLVGWGALLFVVSAFFYHFVRRANRFDWLEEELLAYLNWGTSGVITVMGGILAIALIFWLKKPSDGLAKKLFNTH